MASGQDLFKGRTELEQLLASQFERGRCKFCEHLVDDHRGLKWPKGPPIVCDEPDCSCTTDELAPKQLKPIGRPDRQT